MDNNPDKTNEFKYCNSFTNYSRWLTRIVNIGHIPMGGHHPVRIQSMTSTPTLNTKATVAQAIRMVDAGCEYVRITAQNLKEAANLAVIKEELRKKGYKVPLIADVHFNPEIALAASKIVEKIRINPGNYAVKTNRQRAIYTEAAYLQELEFIREKLRPLIKSCREHGTAIRIGTNHGSLSDRIMSRHGDTVQGMVESALEFIRICESLDFHDLIISMKSSNIKVMVQAYRLLVNRMMAESMNYPLHLGVTEAGEGVDGRLKSAAGIGALLEDGLGDTIRISLTEEPEKEIPVALTLLSRYKERQPPGKRFLSFQTSINPYSFTRRESQRVMHIGADALPVIIMQADSGMLSDSYLQKPDFIYSEGGHVMKSFQGKKEKDAFPVFRLKEYLSGESKSIQLNFLQVNAEELDKELIGIISRDKSLVLILEPGKEEAVHTLRSAFSRLIDGNCKVPVIIRLSYPAIDTLAFHLFSAADLAFLFVDGLGDGVWLDNGADFPVKDTLEATFGILQAIGVRISKTEYISCPSCGRTLFDIQARLHEIKKHTSHLRGLKIGVMGCIVNGPGEMADANYGYVGSGEGKVTIYKGREVVRKNVAEADALQALTDVIKKNGDWKEQEENGSNIS